PPPAAHDVVDEVGWTLKHAVARLIGLVLMTPCRGKRQRTAASRRPQIVRRVTDVRGIMRVHPDAPTDLEDPVRIRLGASDLVSTDEGSEVAEQSRRPQQDPARTDARSSEHRERNLRLEGGKGFLDPRKDGDASGQALEANVIVVHLPRS